MCVCVLTVERGAEAEPEADHDPEISAEDL